MALDPKKLPAVGRAIHRQVAISFSGPRTSCWGMAQEEAHYDLPIDTYSSPGRAGEMLTSS